MQCRHVATGSLIHINENLRGRDGYALEKRSALLRETCVVYSVWELRWVLY